MITAVRRVVTGKLECCRVWLHQIIDLLELRPVADTIIGTTDTGLSVGERKRYTIGVELVTNPSVLFLGTWSCCPCRSHHSTRVPSLSLSAPGE